MAPISSLGVEERSAQVASVRFRRAVSLLLMTLLLPGSAQLVAGRREVGRVAIRVSLALLGSVVSAVLVGLVWPGFVFWLLSNTFMLGLIRIVLFAAAVGWAALFVDAWRLGQPLGLLQRQRLAMVGINGFLCLTVAGSLLFASHVVAVQRDFITAMFGDGTASDATHGRYNVLLLGGDSGNGRWGLRPDSITVASIDEETGKTILFGLPRNLAKVPFPGDSVMAGEFPDGFDCDGCYLNGLSTWAEDHAALFEGHDKPGVEATIEGVEGITGLQINYYAMVNLKGFRKLVDAVGGVTLRVRDRIPVGGLGTKVTGYLEPGRRKLDGFETLWFARSREGADDYARMARQKCVMNAMLHQLSPRKVLTKYEKIAKASQAVVTTDLPASELGRFVDLAMKAKSQRVATVSFVPPRVNTSDPDYAEIRDTVQAAIERSENPQGSGQGSRGKAARPHGERRRPGAGAQTTSGSIGSSREGYAANDALDLRGAC